ncbi:hypothetical protein HPP92_020015 [Vanilla planifolia]|uniref:ARM repeat N-terminal plant domain-containing protein n=1 Tax=Vanilla planifolia TaxID=51239 RepID=A0A835UNG1_VANPL|nr:hypothetical protein HPP92_020015 [Vanilla planifolia]
MSWIEQRVAVRALGHLASFDETFPAVARHGNELVPLAMRVAATCLRTVYEDFIVVETLQQNKGGKMRRKYQRELLTRGLGNGEMETRKAEEWASQLQCWSIYLLGCFAWRDASWHCLICKDEAFLKDLCNMWGGVANGDSPAGVGLMRILCRSELGRKAVSDCADAIESLCNLARSTDDWQYMGIDCLLLLLEDPAARRRVLPFAAPCLADLIELRKLGKRTNLGDAILKSLWPEVKEMWERRRMEERMSEDETAARREAATGKKKEGNRRFWAGEVKEAMEKYGEALKLCPLKRKNERMVLYSNRAQCQLLLGDADAAISDATRALSLSTPVNSHRKSLWRRAQAYDMKGMAKESMIDCLTLVNGAWFGVGRGKKKKKSNNVPYSVARMISKQISRAGLFASVGEFTKEKAAEGSVEFGMGEEER